ncbi:DUF4342 domain-containing protein [uncultured Clostridium sp.]|uniref:DUF4342 domain-containing protein n=1 Tax=uncultured Clostridium sp. TaxID=59620 RepID=UPI0028E35095|nr:DUF4342 domain-containing protein [uncultured Clostridium sp.]
MSEITIEKIDIIRERTKVSYAEAKEALEMCDGNVVDALIYVEENKKKKREEMYISKDEFIAWIKDLINKGNVNRIKIKKGDKVIADIPVNAGVAVTIAGLWASPLIALALFAAALTQITIEITKTDGSVEVVNKIIKSTVDDVKEKVQNKFNNDDRGIDENNMYTYSVDFEEVDKEDENK